MINYFHKNNYLIYFIKWSGWLLIFLAALEIFTRSLIIKLPHQKLVSRLGYVPVENSRTVWGIEGFGVTHYLSNGEIFTPYQSGASVVVLGDSYTDAFQVSDDQKYVSVAEKILHQRGVKMDLHNLGNTGRNLADYVYIAPFIKAIYSPKIVVVQLSESDFTESLSPSRQNYFIPNGKSVTLVRSENYFTFDLNFQNAIRSTGLGSLAVYKLTPIVKEQRLRFTAPWGLRVKREVVSYNALNPNEINMQITSLKDAYPDAELVFLIIPEIPLIQAENLVWSNKSDDLFIDAIGAYSDSPLLYPREGFIELYNEQDKFPRGFFNTLPNKGHLNSDGNFVIGAALAEYLEAVIK